MASEIETVTAEIRGALERQPDDSVLEHVRAEQLDRLESLLDEAEEAVRHVDENSLRRCSLYVEFIEDRLDRVVSDADRRDVEKLLDKIEAQVDGT